MATFTLNLTIREIELMIAATRLCVPTGGGSDMLVLYNKVCDQTGLREKIEDLRYLDSIVISEWKEANEID